jgi:hypothetical protein
MSRGSQRTDLVTLVHGTVVFGTVRDRSRLLADEQMRRDWPLPAANVRPVPFVFFMRGRHLLDPDLRQGRGLLRRILRRRVLRRDVGNLHTDLFLIDVTTSESERVVLTVDRCEGRIPGRTLQPSNKPLHQLNATVRRAKPNGAATPRAVPAAPRARATLGRDRGVHW